MDRLYDEIQNWMVRHKKTSVRPATYDRLERSLILMGEFAISNIPADILTSEDIQDYINELVSRGYALSTIKKQVHLIGEFISYCNLKGTITAPLHKGVKLPSETVVKKHKKEVVAYSRDEQRKLKLILLRGDSPIFYSAVLMIETGLRVGEALALEWSDIDFNKKSIRVHRTVVRIADSKRNYIQEGAKSFTSNRTIPLSSEAYRLLSYMRDHNDGISPLVFHNSRGRLLTYEAVRWWVRKACNEAGVPYYGCHVFRHTFATNCYNKGCDVKVLSKFLGHSDVTITYNVYIHLFGDALEEMRSILD